MSKSTLFTSDLPKIIPMDKLYDPDVDDQSSINTTKIIPAVNSLLVDNVYIYIVTSVNEVTGKSTYRPLSVIDTGATQRIFEYGNTMYALFFAPVQITDSNGNKLQLTRLNVDDKLTFFGQSVTNYCITKTSSTGVETIISEYFDESNTNAGRICKIAGEGEFKKCVPCYTYDIMEAGSFYTLKAYDSAGNLVTEFKLIGIEASALSFDLEENPIIDFYVRANQFTNVDGLGTNAIFLYKNQNVDELNIWPIIKYADGSEEHVVIDNVHGFIYGMEEVRTDLVGSTYNILVKYAIGRDVNTSITTGYGENRFLSYSFDIHIIDAQSADISKIQLIPTFDPSNNRWTLGTATYFIDRSMRAVLSKTAEVEGFDGSLFGVTQNIRVKHEQLNPDGSITERIQDYNIEVRDNPDSISNPFLFSDKNAVDGKIFGNDRLPDNIPPQIKFGLNPVNNQSGYFFPTDTYASPNFNSKAECFLHNFYFNANPPMSGSEDKAPTPTHFTIRTVGRNAPLFASPIPVEDFENVLPIINTVSGNPGQWVGTTLIVEFWKENNTNYDILYGVPVRVVNFEE